MRPSRVAGDEAGFTLIEMMITLVILSVGLMALAGLQVAAIKGNASAKRMTAATALADAKLEALKDTPYANLQSESSTAVAAAGLNFTRQVTVTPNSPTPATTTVRVVVTWTEGAKSYTVPLSTIISRP